MGEAVGAGTLPVVLGGDHSVAMGTIAGLARHLGRRREKLGLIWFDAHADANTPETSPSGNIHGMPLAAVLGHGAESLVNLAGFLPMVEASHASLVGLRDVDPAERAHRQVLGRRRLHDARHRRARHALGDGGGDRARDHRHRRHPRQLRPRRDRPRLRPGVGTPSPGGLSYREAHLAMEMLADTGKVLSAELVEVNPILDQRNGTAVLAVELLCSLLGKKIL